MSDIKIFEHKDFGQVRTIKDGSQIWWVAKDVCQALNLSNTSMAMSRLDNDERGKFNLGRQGETNCVNEAGLYNLVLGSKKPEAKQFKRWVTHEVIPSIRKTGSYSLQDNNEFDLMRQIVDKLEETHQIANEAKEEVADVKDTFAQIEENWRDYVNNVFSSIGQETGDYSTYRTESYIQLERKAKCNLDARLRNLKERKEKAGATKTEIKETNKLDVIGLDQRLKEIYINIVQEFEAKYL